MNEPPPIWRVGPWQSLDLSKRTLRPARSECWLHRDDEIERRSRELVLLISQGEHRPAYLAELHLTEFQLSCLCV